MTVAAKTKIEADDRILATVSPANLTTREDGKIVYKNTPRLRLCMINSLLSAAGYEPDTNLKFVANVPCDMTDNLYLRFELGGAGRPLTRIKKGSPRSEFTIPTRKLCVPLPEMRKTRCWFRIDNRSHELIIAIPLAARS